MINFGDVLNILDGEDFEERPVEIETFVQSPDYLGLPPLSEYQYQMIKASSQIYKESTLINLYGEDKGRARFRETFNEVIFQLGKGSGKDYTSTVACCYIVYLLLCLKDPARYYGKPADNEIAIINVAINAQQASNVFFNEFKKRVYNCPWFEGKYEEKAGEIRFKKHVTVYSGHSEREAWEGYNVLYCVLDEISGFALDNASGNQQAKTADKIYDMYRASVDSRFPKFGKLVLLSFPRFKGDFIQQRYNEVIGSKEVVMREHVFELPPGPDGEPNSLTIQWEEDHITHYKDDSVYALKRPTWEVNPLVSIDDLKGAFIRNKIDALSRFACMPPDAVHGLFKDSEKVRKAFAFENDVDEFGVWREDATPDPEKAYYIHVDLAKKHDRAAVAMAHVETWQQKKLGTVYSEVAPFVKVDFVRYWTPAPDKEINFREIEQFIVDVRRKGYNIRQVTFDQWQSEDMKEYLSQVGLPTDRLSVDRKHYDDLLFTVHDERVAGPHNDILIDELLKLRILDNGKVDHPRQGSKDLADAVCGAVYNAVDKTPRDYNAKVDVVTLRDFKEPVLNSEQPARKSDKPMPNDLGDWLDGMGLL